MVTTSRTSQRRHPRGRHDNRAVWSRESGRTLRTVPTSGRRDSPSCPDRSRATRGERTPGPTQTRRAEARRHRRRRGRGQRRRRHRQAESAHNSRRIKRRGHHAVIPHPHAGVICLSTIAVGKRRYTGPAEHDGAPLLGGRRGRKPVSSVASRVESGRIGHYVGDEPPIPVRDVPDLDGPRAVRCLVGER